MTTVRLFSQGLDFNLLRAFSDKIRDIFRGLETLELRRLATSAIRGDLEVIANALRTPARFTSGSLTGSLKPLPLIPIQKQKVDNVISRLNEMMEDRIEGVSKFQPRTLRIIRFINLFQTINAESVNLAIQLFSLPTVPLNKDNVITDLLAIRSGISIFDTPIPFSIPENQPSLFSTLGREELSLATGRPPLQTATDIRRALAAQTQRSPPRPRVRSPVRFTIGERLSDPQGLFRFVMTPEGMRERRDVVSRTPSPSQKKTRRKKNVKKK